MSSNSLKPAFYKNEITDEDMKKLKEIFDKMEKDKNSLGFLDPVDYEALGLHDYPTIVKRPMDLGTCKKNLLNGKYKIFQELIDDLNLIWENCRLYNLPGSAIVKCGNACEKKMKQLIEKQFKNAKHKVDNTEKENKLLSDDDKAKLIDNIRHQNNEGLTQIVKKIIRLCPEAIEDIDNDKLQIKVDFLRYRDLAQINEELAKINSENHPINNDNENENAE